MQFKKFSSLENIYRQNLIDKVQYEGKDGGEWIVTEKIHGANFSFWCDGESVRVASRSQFVDGTFYNCQEVIDRYSDGVLDWCKKHNVNDLVIYGELFGKGVQKEVEYGQRDFRAFDVVVDGKVEDNHTAICIASACGIEFSPVIFVGSFNECMKLNNTFQSKLTPNGYEGENFAEGFVIEPIVPQWFNNGSRIYFKNKTESFSEKKRKPKEQKVFELNEEDNELLSNLLAYSTEQRVSNVISKVGYITNKDFGKILGLTVQDILEEFEKEEEISPEDNENWKQISKLLSVEVGKSVRTEFLKHIE